MTVVVYQSTDASAPVMSGQVGALIGVLDACLVNGYGSKAAAGWTKPYSGTNTASYRQGSGSNGFYLDVNDNAPATAQEARLRGYETMSAVATGTGGFPTTVQMANGLFARKSNTANSTARPWVLVADATCFYLFVDTGDDAGAASGYLMFGDFFAYGAGDTYSSALIARYSENSTLTYNVNMFGDIAGSGTTTMQGHYSPRTYNGTGSAVAFTKLSHSATFNSNQAAIGGSAAFASYPNGADSGLHLAPINVAMTSTMRGYLKGLWAPLHNRPLGHKDTFSGTGAMTGKTFMAINTVGAGNVGGQIMIETSNTWS